MGTTRKGLAEALWPVARRRILGLLLAQPDQELHLREIARRTKLAPATVQREAVSLATAGILERRCEGRQVYYRADRACPIFAELQGIVLKTVGLVDVLREALQPLQEQIDAAFLFGSLADGSVTNESDVDVVVIGRVSLRDLAPHLQQARERLGREVNPVVMRPQEWRRRMAEGDHFLDTVLHSPKVFVWGDADDLSRLAEREATAKA